MTSPRKTSTQSAQRTPRIARTHFSVRQSISLFKKTSLRLFATPALISLLWVLGRGGLALAAENPSATSNAPSFADFQIVVDRNIFDSERTPRKRSAPSVNVVRTAEAERITLLGTLIDGKERLAFLSGSKGTYSGTFRPGDKIEGMQLVDVSITGIRIAEGERSFDLPVGMILTRSDDDSWQVTARPTPMPSARRTESAGGSASSGGSSDDILKRLAERRRKETGEKPESSEPPAPEPESPETAAPPQAAPTDTATGSSSDTEDILKRLREKRQRETQR